MRCLSPVCCLLLGLVIGVSGCRSTDCRDETFTYQSVRSGNPLLEKDATITTSPQSDVFLVRDRTLYLLVQKTCSEMLRVRVTPTEWDEQAIRDFRQSHLELEEYWPDPQSPTGGVEWLPNVGNAGRGPRDTGANRSNLR